MPMLPFVVPVPLFLKCRSFSPSLSVSLPLLSVGFRINGFEDNAKKQAATTAAG